MIHARMDHFIDDIITLVESCETIDFATIQHVGDTLRFYIQGSRDGKTQQKQKYFPIPKREDIKHFLMYLDTSNVLNRDALAQSLHDLENDRYVQPPLTPYMVKMVLVNILNQGDFDPWKTVENLTGIVYDYKDAYIGNQGILFRQYASMKMDQEAQTLLDIFGSLHGAFPGVHGETIDYTPEEFLEKIHRFIEFLDYHMHEEIEVDNTYTLEHT